MASNYGWDWGPVLIPAGIAKPLVLRGWATARLGAVRPLGDAGEDGTGVLRAHVDVRRAGAATDLTASVQVDGVHGSGVVPAGETAAVVEVRVPDVQRW